MMRDPPCLTIASRAHHCGHGFRPAWTCQPRACDHDKTVAQEGTADQAFVRIGVDPDHEVEPFLDHVDGTVLRRHL